MGNLANKMLEAMGIIADAAAASQNFDRTVQAQIISINQQDATEYIVSYNGANYSAKGATGYTVQSIVWVTVPGNDFGQKLQIIGLSSSIDASTQVLKSSENEFETITSNLAQLNSQQSWSGNNIVLYERQAGRDNPTTDLLGLTDGERITNAINSSLYFEIGTIITTTFSNYTGDENFGIKCTFNNLSIGKDGVLILDINDFSGNPYYLIGESQKKVFSIPSSIEGLELLKIELFFENIPAGSSITFNSFTFYGCRMVDRKDGLEAVMRFVSGSDNIIIPLEGKELGTADSLTFETVLRKDGVLIENETELNSYNYQWYLKTLEDGAALRLLVPDWSEAAFCGTTIDWELDESLLTNVKIKQYKGVNSVVYIPVQIIKVEAYDKVAKVDGDSERISEFPSRSIVNTVYYSRETKQYYKGGADGQYILTDVKSLAEDSNIAKINVSWGDGETALFKAGNNVEAIVFGDSDNNIWNNVARPNSVDPIRTRETVYLQYLTNTVFYFKPSGKQTNTWSSYIKSFRIIKTDWAELVATKPNQLKIHKEAFFMPKSYLQCRVLHKLNNSNAKTEEEPITHSASRYKIEFVVGDIGRGDPDKSADTFVSAEPDTSQNIDNWYQTIAFAVNNNDYWPTETLKYSWYKNGEVKISSIQSRYRSITIPVPTTNNETWKGEIYTTTNFFIYSYETTLTSRPAPQDPTENGLVVDLVGQSLFLIKEDGTWPNGQALENSITAYITHHTLGGSIEFPDIEDCNFTWKLNGTVLNEKNNFLETKEDSEEEKERKSKIAFKEINIVGNVLTFIIKTPYVLQYIENFITCEVELKSDTDISGQGQYEPSFVRNGQAGTNGTNFLCRFTMDGGNSFPEYLISGSINTTNLTALVKNVVNNSLVESSKITYFYENNQKINEDGQTPDFSDINNHKALYATYEAAGDSSSTYYTSIPIIKLQGNTTIIEPTTSLQVVFGQSGRLASGLPITITLGSGSSTIKSLEGKYLKATQEESVITISLKDTFEKYNGDIPYEILILQDETMIPILLSSNRFEYTAINGWDGTSVKIDETNDTVLAPTAGFGKKENDNSFTGVMLGSIIPTGENYEIIKCSSVTTNKVIYDGAEIVPGENTVNKFYLDTSDIAEGRSEGQYYITRSIKDSEGNISYYFEKTLPPDFTGILGMNHGNTTFSLDSNTGSLFAKGHIEATSGKIGGVEFKALRETGNRNLLLASGTPHVATEKKIATYTPSSPLNAGETYTVTMFCKPDPQKRVDKISLLSSQSYMSVVNLSFTTEEKDNYDNYYRKTATFTMKYYPNMSPSDNSANAEISFWQYNNSAETVVGNCEIKWVKIEKGVYSSDWSPAPEDIQQDIDDLNNEIDKKINQDSNGSFENANWDFHPKKGLLMWGGKPAISDDTDPKYGDFDEDKNLVFKIGMSNNTPQLYMRGNGTFTGEIHADQGGQIGGFTIKPHQWLEYKSNDSTVGCGMGVSGHAYAFWAGAYTGNTPGANSKFRVGHDGKFYAEEGIFGPWTLSKEGLTGTDFKVGANGLYIGKKSTGYFQFADGKFSFYKEGEGSSINAEIYQEEQGAGWYLSGFGFKNINGGFTLNNASILIQDASGNIELKNGKVSAKEVQGILYSSDGTKGYTNTTFTMNYMATAVNGYTLYIEIKDGLITNIYTKDT